MRKYFSSCPNLRLAFVTFEIERELWSPLSQLLFWVWEKTTRDALARIRTLFVDYNTVLMGVIIIAASLTTIYLNTVPIVSVQGHLCCLQFWCIVKYWCLHFFFSGSGTRLVLVFELDRRHKTVRDQVITTYGCIEKERLLDYFQQLSSLTALQSRRRWPPS